MPTIQATPPISELLELAARDRRSATRALDAMTPDDQVAALCGAPLARRAELLGLVSSPERLVPRLPEAELCFIVKSVGVEDASWILESATPEQIVACLDLDGWTGLEPDRRNLESWLGAVAAAGEKTVVGTAQNVDPELLVGALQERATVVMRPGQDEAEDFEPPPGAKTLEGQFYVLARRPNDDLASLMAMLDALFRNDYWLYFRLMQGAIWELATDLDEWALRWRSGRLEDLGFPTWDESMRIYGYVRPDRRSELAPPDEAVLDDDPDWRMPVWSPRLPIPLDGGESVHAIFRAASRLDVEERSAFFFSFISLANRVAVADRMPLGDADTLPMAIEKAAAIASIGLAHVAEARGIAPEEALRRASPIRLYRVGASVERDAGRSAAPALRSEEDDD